MKASLIVVNIYLICLIYKSDGCLKRYYGSDKIVCVCNATYCDTIKVDKPGNNQVLKYVTTKTGLRFEKYRQIFEATARYEIIDINAGVHYQTIHGWGGAFTDAAGINIASLNEESQQQLLKSYFSSDGLDYNLCRVPIGGTDFSTRSYSYDDGPEDIYLKNFKLAPEDYKYKLPFLKKALEYSESNLQFFASAWTAPKWMKTNNEQSGFGFLKLKMYQPWANYFIKFLRHYKQEGIDFWGITTGNEPVWGFVPVHFINSVGWTPQSMSEWIANYLGPTLRLSEFSSIKLITLDDQRFFLPTWVDIVLKNKRTRKYVDGIGVHWYFDKYVPASLLTETHNRFPDKFILGTEASNGLLPLEPHVDLGSWERGEDYANSIIEDTNHWVTGWVDWCLALDLQGGPAYLENFVDSPIIVNKNAGEFYKQPMFYALGHFSKFVPRNSVRIFSTMLEANLPSVAFRKPDDSIAIVLLNKYNMRKFVSIHDKRKGFINVELMEKSITTIIYS